MDDLDRGEAEHLVAQAAAGAVEVGELLGGQQHADAGLAPAGQQREHVSAPQRRELVDRRSWPAAVGCPQPSLAAVPGGADQVLDASVPSWAASLP